MKVLERLRNQKVIQSATTTGELDIYKQKTFTALMRIYMIALALTIVIAVTVNIFLPGTVTRGDLIFFISAAIVMLIGLLVLTLIKAYISFSLASLLFTVFAFLTTLAGDTLDNLFRGRSLPFLILPIIIASILIRPWAGWVVAILYGAPIIIVPIYMHLGFPNIVAFMLLFIVAYIMDQAISNLERVTIKEMSESRRLFESQDRYQKITETSPNAILIVDPSGQVLECNETAWKMYGASSKQEFMDSITLDAFTPRGGEFLEKIRSVLQEHDHWSLTDYKHLRKDGTSITIDITATTLTNFDAKPTAFLFTIQNVTERKQAENALRASEEKYRQLIDILPIGIGVHQNEKIQLINPTGAKILGLEKPEELIGKPYTVLIPLEFHDRVRAEIQSILKNRSGTQIFDVQLLRHNGDVFDAEITTVTFQVGDQTSILFTFTDVTERKIMGQALRESEENYRLLIESLPIGLMVHQGGPIRMINPMGARILGVDDPRSMIGATNMDFVHPEFKKLVKERMKSTMKEGKKAELVQEKLIRRDGTVIDVEVIGMPVKFSDQPSMLVMFQDITEQKQSEAALRASEEKFSQTFHLAPMPLAIANPQGQYMEINQAFTTLLGYQPEDVIGHTPTEVEIFVSPGEFKKALQILLEKGRLEAYEMSVRAHDGRILLGSFYAEPLVLNGEHFFLTLMNNITEQVRAQKAIKAQNKRIQEVSRQLLNVQERERHMLAAELHDDLGQSLTSLKLMGELAARTKSQQKRMALMEEARTLLTELMNKVRNLSLDLRPAMLDDFGLFPALRWLFERYQAQTGISIRSECDLESNQRFPPLVETTAFRIIQEALTNIARHAGVKSALVRIEIDKNISIEVSDQGAGFDYRDGKKNLTHTGGISGMQERARLLGGKVKIQSKVGSGTRVMAEIPLEGKPFENVQASEDIEA